MSKYSSGRAFEYQVRDRLRKDGYMVFRFAGSKPLDLVAVRRGKILFCECKSGKPTLEDRRKVGEWSAKLGYPVALFQKTSDGCHVEVFEAKQRIWKNVYAMLDAFLQYLLEKHSEAFPNDDCWVNLSQLDTSRVIWEFLVGRGSE